MADIDEDELLADLGLTVTPPKNSSRTPREERIIAGFEDILRFQQVNGRAPQHGENRDIFERLYAMRLDQLRKLPEVATLLAPLDTADLLTATSADITPTGPTDEDALLAELGVVSNTQHDDIITLRNVRSYADKRAAEEIADRTVCKDFEKFKPLFDGVKSDLQSGARHIRSFTRKMDEIQKGTFFVVGGQIAYVAEVGEEFTTQYERRDSRLRVVFDNETESNVLQRSLQRALHRDEAARLITDPSAGPLFGETPEGDDIESGTIYVLRSLSNHPFVSAHRELIHKIGVTGGAVEARIAGAEKDATYLLADVQVIAEYKLHNLNRIRLENIFHRLFSPAQIDLTITDRFGHPVKPREWFLIPLQVIDEAVQRIRDGSITNVVYDPTTARLISAP